MLDENAHLLGTPHKQCTGHHNSVHRRTDIYSKCRCNLTHQRSKIIIFASITITILLFALVCYAEHYSNSVQIISTNPTIANPIIANSTHGITEKDIADIYSENDIGDMYSDRVIKRTIDNTMLMQRVADNKELHDDIANGYGEGMDYIFKNYTWASLRDNGYANTTTYQYPRYSHISQGFMGDCWLASLISVILTDRTNTIVDSIITYSHESDGQHIYQFNYFDWKSNKRQSIYLDDQVPYNYINNRYQPLFGSDLTGDADAIPMLIEKGMAYVFGGYQNINGNEPYIGWYVLTGRTTLIASLEDERDDPKGHATKKDIIQYMIDDQCIRLACLGVDLYGDLNNRDVENDTDVRMVLESKQYYLDMYERLNLDYNHEYTVLKLFRLEENNSSQPLYYFLLRNPHGLKAVVLYGSKQRMVQRLIDGMSNFKPLYDYNGLKQFITASHPYDDIMLLSYKELLEINGDVTIFSY